MKHEIIAFTKPDCPYCAQAKAVLDEAGLAYELYDVTASERYANASVYFSGVSTVPQVFFGDFHINGSGDLAALNKENRLDALAQAAHGELPVDEVSDEELARGAEDFVLRKAIPESDGTHDEDPDAWPILHFYKEFFGFWPNCFYFLHHWPEAYKLFVYCHNVGAIGGARDSIGAPVMMSTGFASSNAHGCNYCQVHMTVAGGEQSLGISELVEAARKGIAAEGSPIGPFELALTDLAADATKNTVTDAQLKDISNLAPEARRSNKDPEANIMGTAMIASAFGFLNVFNDMTGVEVEAEWAAKAKSVAVSAAPVAWSMVTSPASALDGAIPSGVGAGRHGVSDDRVSNNLDYDLPEGGPSMQEMITKYDGIVHEAGGAEAYAIRELGLTPSWMKAWPEHLRARHVYLYTELMELRDHSPIPSELKHLMAHVSAVARGHDYLAAIEAWLAHRAAGRTKPSLERIRHAFDTAKDRLVDGKLFEEREIAALRLAWLSAQLPLTTPRRFIEPAIKHFSPVELVHLITVGALAGLVQRFVAIAKPEMEAEVAAFMQESGLETDTLKVRYALVFPDRNKDAT